MCGIVAIGLGARILYGFALQCFRTLDWILLSPFAIPIFLGGCGLVVSGFGLLERRRWARTWLLAWLGLTVVLMVSGVLFSGISGREWISGIYALCCR